MGEPAGGGSKERHDYARHLFQVTITWYTWFIALNYGVLGWLSSRLGAGGPPFNAAVLWLVCLLFLSHNALGLVWLFTLRSYIRRLGADPATGGVVPDGTFNRGLLLMSASLVSLVLAWVVMPFVW